MSNYHNNTLFMEPQTKQYGSHMIMTNVHKKSQKKYINIDTKFRDNYNYLSNVDFNIQLPEVINDVKSMRVTNIELPHTFYNISANLKNNFFRVTQTTTNNTEMIIIDDNYYTAATLQFEINQKLVASNLGAVITTTVQDNSKTILVSTASDRVIDFDVNIDGGSDKYNVKNKLGWLLGYRKFSYNLTSNVNTVAENNVNLNTHKYLYLAIDEFQSSKQNTFISPLFRSIINKNIIARISIDYKTYPYGNIIHANNGNGLLLSDSRDYTGTVNLQKLHLQLLSDIGDPISLNGDELSFCIEVSHE
jgi:hypothetical protein